MIDPTERIAIVGLGAIFPGAPDPARFWDAISKGIDLTTEVPDGRWALSKEEAYDPRVAVTDRLYATRGGFVTGFDLDPEGLDLDSALLAGLDVSAKLALHAGRQAWRDAVTAGVDHSRVGVILGNIVLPTDATSMLADEVLGRAFEKAVLGTRAPDADPDASLTHPINRLAAALPAGLLAQALGLGGVAYTLDAACASSIYALKLAADELLSGRADAMLTGGVSRPDALYTQMGFSQLRALAPDGRARPFDAQGSGLVVGEGAGVFVLKRLGDAIRAGDTIHGLIAAVGLSNDVDGGLLAPSSEGQLRAMRQAYETAGWDPSDVDLVECHATGTPVGDAVEFQSLKTLWGPHTAHPHQCVIGSHKANIGHSLTAAGAAGLLKVLFALRNETLPPTPNFASFPEALRAGETPFRVLTAAGPWRPRRPGQPRRAALSGFGFGGINAHALIEEYVPGSVASPTANARPTLDPEGEADPAPLAVVGVGAHFGPFAGIEAVKRRLLGGETETLPTEPANDWGVFAAPGERPTGYHLDALTLRLDGCRIPPKEREEMLPQQSLALLAASEAIASARWDDRPKLRAGVFVGLELDPNTTNFHVRWGIANKAAEWARKLGLELDGPALERWVAELREAMGPALNANRTMGALGGLVASRIAREFRVGGPSFTVSSGETSGLRALEIASRLLRQHEIDQALVAAVDLTGDPRVTVAARRAGIEPLTRGDGAAALVLKRLDDAERDGDRILAVIRGVASSSGGGIDTENIDKQATDTAIRLALDEAGRPEGLGLNSATVSERQAATGRRPDPIGNVPSSTSALTHLGHTGAAAGLATLVESVISLHEQILPPDGDIGPRFWLRDRADGPRRAIVTATSTDGTGSAVVLESYEATVPAENPIDPLGPPRQAILVVQADETAGLIERLTALESLASANPELSVFMLARRWHGSKPDATDRRLAVAIVAEDRVGLTRKLAAARRLVTSPERTRNPAMAEPGVHFAPEPLGPTGSVAFVYPGIGNHYVGMGRELSARWPEIYRRLDAETLRLRSQLAPGAGWNSIELSPFADHRAPILAQVVLGTAVTDLLAAFGVVPEAVLGYSLGESSALFATRAWTARDEMHAHLEGSTLFASDLAGDCNAARRAWRLRPEEPVDWVAGIVPCPAEKVRAALADVAQAYLLIINSPAECVIGGRRRSVERLVKALGGLFLPLPTVSTVHCEIARQVEQAYRELHLMGSTPPENLRYFSAGWGRSYRPDRETAADAIVAQAVDTVDFPAVVERAHSEGVRVFIEVGPGASCTRLIPAILGQRPHLALAACVPGQNETAALLDLLARLAAHRVPVDLSVLYRPEYGKTAQSVGTRSLRVEVGGAPFRPPIPTQNEPNPAGVRADVFLRNEPNPAPISIEPVLQNEPNPAPEPTDTSSRNEPNAWPGTPDLTPRFPGTPPWRNEPNFAPNPDPGATLPLNPMPMTDPLAAAVSAAESSRGRAHESYLHTASGFSQTLSNALAFQMALVESLLTPGPAPAVDRRPPLDRRPMPVLRNEPNAAGARDAISQNEPNAAAPPALPAKPAAPRAIPTTVPTALDRDACMEFAVGLIGNVLGRRFAAADAYPTRVRLPAEPLMLVDRIVSIEGEPLSMSHGRVVTEHDVLPGDWYLDAGKIPAAIAIESGQADLFLSGYLGIDFETKGERVYRLLDAAVIFHRELPAVGSVIQYDIHISGFFRQGETYLFRFHFDATVDGEPLVTMRDGCAGFFSEEELASGQGIIRRPLDLRPLPGKKPADWKPLAPLAVESLDDHQVSALRAGDLGAAFGPAFASLGLKDPFRLPGGRLTLLHRVPHIDPTGGRYGLGLIRSELDIHPDDWFITCHFIDDQVMPGTLMYECCLHTLRIYLMRLGWVGEAEGVSFEPVPGVASRLRCRGQVLGSTRKAVFELAVKEIGYGPEPYAVADALMYADGKPIVEVTDMTLRFAGLAREQVEALWSGPARPAALYTREHILAFAYGNPSEAFGDRYLPFDHNRFIARLPSPPYSFLDRVLETEGAPWVMAPGAGAVAEYDVPADAWYFAAERQPRMPFAVLLEIPLQVCGWLAAWMGSALTSDQDMAFRNLGGEGLMLAEVTPSTGTLTTRVRTTGVSSSGGMIIQHYSLETWAGDTPVYRGTTYFGFFRHEALADQVGIREAKPYQPTPAELARARSFEYPRQPPFPDEMLRMLDTVDVYVPDGGPKGLGLLVGSAAVDPSDWFFKAHFYQDPVCPGSLGLESFLQLLKVFTYERWGDGRPDVAFEPIALGVTHRWVYRGQIIPTDARVTTRAVVTEVDDARRLVKADGFLEVDGRVIYQMTDFSLRLL